MEAPDLGGGSIGGGDLLDSYDWSAWFLGPKTIHYCIEAAEDFPLSPTVLREKTEEAFQIWKDYIEENGVNAIGTYENIGTLATKRAFLEKCNGKEDIAFYFGIQNDRVARAKKKFLKPIGFAERVSYDRSLGWGKGFVWLEKVSNLSEFSNLKYGPDHVLVTLLHELGHVYGNSHINDTVMTSSAIDLLNHVSSGWFAREGESKFEINWRDNLYTCLATHLLVGGNTAIPCRKKGFTAYDNDDTKAALQSWLGREIKGTYSLNIKVDLPSAIFTIQDENGREYYPVLLDKVPREEESPSWFHSCNGGGDRIFYRIHPGETESDLRCSSLVRKTATFFTRLFRKDGTRHNLILTVDRSDRMRIRTVADQKWERIDFKPLAEAIQNCDLRQTSKNLEDAIKRFGKEFQGGRWDVSEVKCDSSQLASAPAGATSKEFVENTLRRSCAEMETGFVSFQVGAYWEGLPAALLQAEYAKAKLKYEMLTCKVKAVESLLDQDALWRWHVVERAWRANENCVEGRAEDPEVGEAPFDFPLDEAPPRF